MATKNENTKIETLQESVQSLQFDMDRVVKPGINKINSLLEKDLYLPKATYVEDKKTMVDRIVDLEKTTRNTPTVEKVVFGLVGLLLLAIGGAVVSLVILQGGTKP